MFFGSDRRNLHKTLLKTLRRNDDFTLTSHCDFTTIGATSCDVNVKSLWREFEDVMTSFFDLTLWLHKVKSLCHFNGENVTLWQFCIVSGDKIILECDPDWSDRHFFLLIQIYDICDDSTLDRVTRFYPNPIQKVQICSLFCSCLFVADLWHLLWLYIESRDQTLSKSDPISSDIFFLRGRRGDAGLRRFWRFYIGSDYQISVDSDPESSDWFFFLQIKFVLRL